MSYDRFHKRDKAPTVIVGCLIALVVVFMVYKYFMKPKRGSACPSAKMTPTYVSSRSDLDSFINSEEDTTVMYYAPWCGHCNKAKPEFEEAMKNNNNMLTCNGDPNGKDSVLSHSDLKELGIQGFPTVVKYGPDGKKKAQYNGPRTSKGFSEFAK